jgi:hypothetical protein
MTHAELPLKGRCLCGSVQIELTSMPLLTLACHCKGCQKFSASDYSLTAMFPTHDFSVSGELVLGGLKSDAQEHYFCASCMCFVYSRGTEPKSASTYARRCWTMPRCSRLLSN